MIIRHIVLVVSSFGLAGEPVLASSSEFNLRGKLLLERKVLGFLKD